MTAPFLEFPKKLMGYDPDSVNAAIADRDAMLSNAERRVRAAEARVAELEEKLELRREEIALLKSALDEASREPVEAPAEPEPARSVTPEFMTQELSRVVAATEETAARILERAWETARHQITEADRLWREVQEEAARFAEWRRSLEPTMAAVQAYIEEARARLEEVPARIQQALSPAAEAMSAVDQGIANFSAASTPPPFVAPSGLEAARALAGRQDDTVPEWPGSPDASAGDRPAPAGTAEGGWPAPAVTTEPGWPAVAETTDPGWAGSSGSPEPGWAEPSGSPAGEDRGTPELEGSPGHEATPLDAGVSAEWSGPDPYGFSLDPAVDDRPAEDSAQSG
jgi:cell division septum initiation protein DivIVA